MPSRVLLLRAVNVGARRVPMPVLRELLTEAGYEDVRTYVQSGNVVIASATPPTTLADECRRIISEGFGFDVPVIVRTGQELARVRALDPLSGVADVDRLYWVSFLDRPISAEGLERLAERAAEGERVVADGRELYAWLPGGAARSKLAANLHKPERGLEGTARNWATVGVLAAMAAELH